MADGQAVFNINLEGNAKEVSGALASEVDKLRQKITGASDRISGMSKLLKNLKGDSDSVTSAKESLKAKISAERDAIAGASAELVKHGASLRKTADTSGVFGRATAFLKNTLANVEARFPGLTSGIKLFAGAVTGAVGVVLALGAALAASFVGLAKWIITAGDARRNTQLMLEAFAGSAKNGEALGTQVDALARKVPIARDKLAEMAVQLMRTRLGGQEIVDTLNVIGEASAAMGDQVGTALGDIIKRGQITRRFRIDPRELFGTGVRFEDVAAQLAKQLRISVADAKQALFTGAVEIGQGAKALRAVVEKRFGEVNGKKLLSLDAIGQRLHDTLANLTSKIDFNRILTPISKLVDLFDVSTVSGKVLQDIITNLGKVLGDTFTEGAPKMKTFFLLAEIAALKVLIGVFRLKKGIEAATGSGNLLIVPFKLLGTLVDNIVGSLAKGVAFANKIAGAVGLTYNAGTKNAFAPEPGGAVVAPGHQRGGLVMRPAPGEAFASVAPGELIIPKGVAGSGYAGGGRGVGKADIKITFNVHGGAGGSGEAVAKQLSEPNFLAMLTKTIEDACKTAGIPTQTTAAP